MDESGLHILIVEDSPADAELCQRELRRAGLEFTALCVDRRDAFQRALEEFKPDLILSDFSMPTAFDGLTALEMARERLSDVPFIFVSGTIGEERAVDAMKLGATDYVLKDHMRRLGPVIRRALRESQERMLRRRAQFALHESEERFRAFMRHLPGRATIRDLDGRYTYVNESWLNAFGAEAREVLGRTSRDILPEDQADVLQSDFQQVRESGSPVQRVVNFGSGDNTQWWLSHHFPILDAAGRSAMIGSISIDITEQKNQEDRLARLSRIYAVLSGINSAIVRIRDRRELLREACRIAVEDGGFGIAWIGELDSQSLAVTPIAWAGFDSDLLIQSQNSARPDVPLGSGILGRAVRERRAVFSNDLRAETSRGGERRKEAMRRGYRSVVVLPLLIEGDAIGTISLFAREVNFFNDDELTLLNDLAGDISFALEHMQKTEKLNYLAYYDPLTDLPNRALFRERLGRGVSSAKQANRPLALVLCDVKRLRFINESFGRQVGDEVLREIGRRLKAMWGDSGNVACIASDCFAGMLSDVENAADAAHFVGQRLTSAIATPFLVGSQELALSVTAGIAVFPDDGEDADTLVKNAEAALNNAKRSGERFLFYQPAMNATVAETLLLESRLRRALEREQFTLHYQPKLDLATGAVRGVEALIRWNDPDAGLIPPGDFIPLLEVTNMILDAGKWIIRQALADYRAWQSQGLEAPRIAVNVSAIQLKQKDFVEGVRAAITGSGTAAHGLDFEITESMIMEDVEGTIEKLRAIQSLGVAISIDDFGTGYCSLGYLARLPVNALKIDRSFITRMSQEPESMSIVSTIITLAHTLNLKVVAEGVDADEQLRLLKLLKCDEIQGYLLSKPLPSDELVRWLKHASAGMT